MRAKYPHTLKTKLKISKLVKCNINELNFKKRNAATQPTFKTTSNILTTIGAEDKLTGHTLRSDARKILTSLKNIITELLTDW